MRVRIGSPTVVGLIGAVMALSACSTQASHPSAATASASSGATAATSPAGSPSANSVATTAAAGVPAGYKRVGGTAQGISVAVPDAWAEINPAQQTMADAAKQLKLPAASASTLVQEAESLVKLHAIVAIDVESAVKSPDHFTRNINAYCSTSGINDTGSAGVPFLQQAAKAEFSTIASNVTQRDVEIGGMPGVETSYQISTKSGTTISAAQLEVLPKPDKACFVTLTFGSPHNEGNYLSVAATTAQFP